MYSQKADKPAAAAANCDSGGSRNGSGVAKIGTGTTKSSDFSSLATLFPEIREVWKTDSLLKS